MNAMDIGHAIRRARKNRALTQAQLAAETGLSRQTIIQIEAGDREIGIMKVMSVLSALSLRIRIEAPELHSALYLKNKRHSDQPEIFPPEGAGDIRKVRRPRMRG